MIAPDLTATALELVRAGRGILAADESVATITKRFEAAGIVSTSESRRAYRDLLVTTPGLADSISGVIFHDETIRQTAGDGTLTTNTWAGNLLLSSVVTVGCSDWATGVFRGDASDC